MKSSSVHTPLDTCSKTPQHFQKRRIARVINIMIISLLLFSLAFIHVLDGASWTIVDNYKYNILDTISNNVKVPYEEGKELCEFQGENSRLFEPQDQDTLEDVLKKIKENPGVAVAIAIEEASGSSTGQLNMWINAIRSEPIG